MIHALLPLYMVTVLGTSTLAVGIIEGIAEATASITKVFSGALSDWLGKRKMLAAFGYGLAAFTRPIFALAASLEWLIAARFIDRVGKGTAARRAMPSSPTSRRPHLRGASFGLRQSLDTIGAFLGPLLAIGLMWLMADNFQAVFWIAAIPAVLAVGLILFAVKGAGRPNCAGFACRCIAMNCAVSARPIGGSWRSRRFLRWRVSAKPSYPAGAIDLACRWRWSPIVLVIMGSRLFPVGLSCRRVVRSRQSR